MQLCGNPREESQADNDGLINNNVHVRVAYQ